MGPGKKVLAFANGTTRIPVMDSGPEEQQPSLFRRDLGERGPVLLFLHGLFGSHRNWIPLARALNGEARSILIDFRNHGSSFHAPSHRIEDLSEDLLAILRSAPEKPFLIGHSMGGLVAMDLALRHPELLKGIVVVDITPVSYPFDHSRAFALYSMDPSRFSSREDFDREASRIEPDREIRQFHMTNLEWDGFGYRWRINVEALHRLEHLQTPSFADLSPSSMPALLITGELSEYRSEAGIEKFHELFPEGDSRTIAGAGHWLPHTHREELLAAIRPFLFS